MSYERIVVRSGQEFTSGKGCFLYLDDGSKVVMWANAPGYNDIEPGIELWATWGRRWNDYDVVAQISTEEPAVDEVPDGKRYDMFKYANILDAEDSAKTYLFKVKKWMTMNKTFEGQDNPFQVDLNEGNAMPMRMMRGHVLAETKGMLFVSLRGYTTPAKSCLHCGRKLTHPVSLLYGIGPICGEHFHENTSGVNIEEFYKRLQESLPFVVWEGWVAKSALQEMIPA